MSEVLSGNDFCFTYPGNIFISSTSWKEHIQHLEPVYNYLIAANLKIKLSKCQFFNRKVHYLRYLISEQDIQPLLEKYSNQKPIKV